MIRNQSENLGARTVSARPSAARTEDRTLGSAKSRSENVAARRVREMTSAQLFDANTASMRADVARSSSLEGFIQCVVRAAFITVLILVPWVLAGCGSTSIRAKLRSGFPYPRVPYRPLVPGEGAFERADGHLRVADGYGLVLVHLETVGGGRIAIVAKQRGLRRHHIELEYNMEEPVSYGPRGEKHHLARAGGGRGNPAQLFVRRHIA